MSTDTTPDPVEVHLLAQLRGDLTDDAAAYMAAVARAAPELLARYPAAREALAEGDRRWPDDARRFAPVQLGPDPVDADPAVAAMLDQLMENDAGAVADVVQLPGARRHPELRVIAGRSDHGYRVGAGVWKLGAGSPLLPWCPEVVEHLVRLDDTGQPVERRYLVRVDASEPVVLTTRDLASSPSDGSCWCDRFPDATGVGTRARRELLLDVVLDQAAVLDPTWMVQRNGWHTTPDGTWCYVRTADPEHRVRPVYRTNANVGRAYAPVGVHAAAEVAGTLAGLAGRGWGPILGLATGCRAIAQAIVPVRHSLVAEGPPNTGKSLTAWMAQLLVMSPTTPGYWPPVADASFADTVNSMEAKIGEAADRAVHVNDMPLTSESTAAELRTAVDKLDRLARALHDNTPVRDRLDRNLDLRESTLVRGVLTFTVQKLPGVVQASLWRRLVVAHFAEGANDWRWYAAHGAELVGPIRSLGDRIIAALQQLGRDRAVELVERCDREGRAELRAAWEALDVAEVAGIEGVVDGAGQLVAGLVLAEALTGLHTGGLLAELVPALAASLAQQATVMRDRQVADAGVGEALGNVIRKACLDRRAHVRDPRDDVARSMVEGLTYQAQGVPEPTDHTGRAQGVAVYVFTDRQALGIAPRELHTLAVDSRDPRLTGYEAEGLARHLLREGVTIPGRQGNARATEQHRIGPRAANVRRRLVMVPLAAVWDLTPPDDDDDDGPGPSPAPPSEPHPAEDDDDETTPPERPPAPPPEPLPLDPPTAAAERPAEAAPVAAERPEPAPGHDRTSGPPAAPQRRSRARARAPESRTTPATIVAVEAGRLAVLRPSVERAWTFGDVEVPGELPELLDAVHQAVPAGPVTLLVAQGDHRRLGLPAKVPRNVARPPAVFRRVRSAGWHRPGHPDQPFYVTRYARLARPGREGVVLVLPVAWLGEDDWPRVGASDGAGVIELADRLAEFRELVGWELNGSTSATGVAMFRDMVAASARRQPYWSPPGQRSWPAPSVWGYWRREPGEGASHVHAWDAVSCHLSAIRQAVITPHELRHSDSPIFAEDQAGYWLVEVPPWPWPEVPAPVLDVEPGASAWTTTAVVKLYVELGVSPELVEAWTARRSHLAGQRRFADHLRGVLAGPGVSADVRPGIKRLYQSFHGKTRSLDQAVIGRPDWGYAIRDQAWCTLLRKVYQGAGMLPLPEKVTGGQRQYAQTPVVPVEMREVDTIVYAGGPEAVAPESFTIGEQLGDFRLKHSATVDVWREGTP